MKTISKISVFFAFILATAHASAALVTISPDDYAHGTNITTANEGVWLQAISQNFDPHSTQEGIHLGDVFAMQSDPCTAGADCDSPYVAPSGENVFGWQHTQGGFGGSWNGAQSFYEMEHFPEWAPDAEFMGLWVNFLQPTDYVSIDVLMLSDPAMIVAYDILGNFLEISQASDYGDFLCCAHGEEGLYRSYQLEMGRGSRDIAHVFIGGDFASTYLDNLTYSVPEPLGVLLFGTGLLGLVLRRHVLQGKK